jgi:excisionase family DNA binding protein
MTRLISDVERQYFRQRDACQYLGVHRSTLHKLARTGRGPRPIRKGRSVFYRKCDLDEWMQQNQDVRS